MLCKQLIKHNTLVSAFVRYSSCQRHLGQPLKTTHPHLIDGEDLTPGISQKEYEDRQLFLLSRLPVGSSIIVGSSSQKFQSWSVPYEYRQNSTFHYLCGIDQPNMLLVLQKLQRNEVRRCLFMKEKPDGKVGYLHPQLYPEDVQKYFGITEVYNIKDIATSLPSIIGESKSLFTYTLSDATIHKAVTKALKSMNNISVSSVNPELDQIRWIKSLNEQKQLRYSSSICCSAFNEVASSPLIGIENRLSALFEYNVKIRGGQNVAFPTMIAGGNNSQYVEYQQNDSIINPGENILIDCGVSMNHYQSDMTRVLFAGDSKSFNKAHTDVYLALNEIYDKALDLLHTQETCSLYDIHQLTITELSRLLIDLGIIKSDNVETVVEQRLFYKYFPHSACHFIGLDNNDTPTIQFNTPLVSGVAFCIEPGLYFDGGDEIPEDLRHFGARVEDTLLYVDSRSIDVLTKDSPRIPVALL